MVKRGLQSHPGLNPDQRQLCRCQEDSAVLGHGMKVSQIYLRTIVGDFQNPGLVYASESDCRLTQELLIDLAYPFVLKLGFRSLRCFSLLTPWTTLLARGARSLFYLFVEANESNRF